MGDTPQTVNQTAQTVDGIIHSVIYDAGLVAAKATLVAALPLFRFPVVSQITDFLLGFFAHYFYQGVTKFSTLQIIQFQTNTERTAYAKSEFNLRQAHLSGDKARLEEATKEFKATFRALVHSDGSFSPD